MLMRLLVLIVAALVTLPVLNFAYGFISAPNDLRVVIGFATLLALVIGWARLVQLCARGMAACCWR
jgi:hypothetical protein